MSRKSVFEVMDNEHVFDYLHMVEGGGREGDSVLVLVGKGRVEFVDEDLVGRRV